jgi:hypothetical protein
MLSTRNSLLFYGGRRAAYDVEQAQRHRGREPRCSGVDLAASQGSFDFG